MNAEQQALVERFRGFLAKIHDRLGEICAEAEVGVKAIAAQHPDDPLPVGNAMTGLDHRVRQLRDKIQETWDSQIEAKFSADPAIHDLGLDMKQDAEIALDERWGLAKARWLGDIARGGYARAAAAMQQPVPCTGCGAPLALAARSEVVAVTCEHCKVVNQVAPSPAVMSYFGTGAQHLAEEAALPLRHAVERQRVMADRWRRARNWAPEPIESLEEWERLEVAYWRRLVEERARVTGAPVDTKLVESRMAWFYKYSLETHQVWVRAKGRRG